MLHDSCPPGFNGHSSLTNLGKCSVGCSTLCFLYSLFVGKWLKERDHMLCGWEICIWSPELYGSAITAARSGPQHCAESDPGCCRYGIPLPKIGRKESQK